ncbi:unnamed protein product [Ectocarpus sp. CCAP 1310/34]|nr:unnamed protein product [Ectocarpus sp. CCAP 1310/34]
MTVYPVVSLFDQEKNYLCVYDFPDSI